MTHSDDAVMSHFYTPGWNISVICLLPSLQSLNRSHEDWLEKSIFDQSNDSFLGR